MSRHGRGNGGRLGVFHVKKAKRRPSDGCRYAESLMSSLENVMFYVRAEVREWHAKADIPRGDGATYS